jgi:WD40 repeat protein
MGKCQADMSRGTLGRIGGLVIRVLRSRTWLLAWLAASLWLALFIAPWRLVPQLPRATFRAGEKSHLHSFSPDAKTLVTVAGRPREWDCPGPLHFWDVPSGRKRWTLAADWERIAASEFSPDGKRFAAMNEDYHLKVWETATGKEEGDVPFQVEAEQRILWEFSPKGDFIIFHRDGIYRPLEDRCFEFLDIKSSQVRARIEAKYGSMTIAADGKSMNLVHIELGEAANSYKIERWRFVDDSRVVERVQTLTLSATSFPCESPDLDRVVTRSHIPGPLTVDEIKLWDFATGKETASVLLESSTLKIGSVRFSPDGKLLIVHRSNWKQRGREDQHLVCQVGTELKPIVTWRDWPDPVVSPNGRWLLLMVNNGARVVETVPGGTSGELRNASDESPSFVSVDGMGPWFPRTKGVFGPDSRTAVLTGLGYNANDGPLTDWLSKVSIRPWRDHYVDVARLWDVERRKELAAFEDCEEVLYSPDGQTLATVHSDGVIRLWDVPPRKPALAILGASVVVWFAVLVGLRLCTRLVRWWLRRLAAAP